MSALPARYKDSPALIISEPSPDVTRRGLWWTLWCTLTSDIGHRQRSWCLREARDWEGGKRDKEEERHTERQRECNRQSTCLLQETESYRDDKTWHGHPEQEQPDCMGWLHRDSPVTLLKDWTHRDSPVTLLRTGHTHDHWTDSVALGLQSKRHTVIYLTESLVLIWTHQFSGSSPVYVCV